jgi:hypothetical protein
VGTVRIAHPVNILSHSVAAAAGNIVCDRVRLEDFPVSRVASPIAAAWTSCGFGC